MRNTHSTVRGVWDAVNGTPIDPGDGREGGRGEWVGSECLPHGGEREASARVRQKKKKKKKKKENRTSPSHGGKSRGSRESASYPRMGAVQSGHEGPPSNEYWRKRTTEGSWVLRERLLDGDVREVSMNVAAAASTLCRASRVLAASTLCRASRVLKRAQMRHNIRQRICAQLIRRARRRCA